MSCSPKSWCLLAATLCAAAILSSCGTTADSSGSGEAAACDFKLVYIGPITGPASGLGEPIHQAAELAVEQYNADTECDVALVKQDSQGSPDQAPNLATEAAQDEAVIGVIGPTFSGESEAAGPIFAEAGLPTVTGSATNPTLAEHGWDTFHRALGNDATQGPAVATYIRETLSAKRVFVIDDASEYGRGLAEIVKSDLDELVVDSDSVQVGQTDFSATVTKVKSAGADAVFFGGYYAEGTLIVSQLRDAGFMGDFVGADGIKDPAFLEAGEAAEDTVITCPCIPPENKQVAGFTKAYQAMFNESPGTYAAEAYDATTIFLDGLAEGVDSREGMLEFINEYNEAGISKHLNFDETGEPEEVHVYAYAVEDGEIVPTGEIG